MSLFGINKQKNNNKTSKIKLLSFDTRLWSFLLAIAIISSTALGYKAINDPNFVGSIKVNLFGDNFKLELVREANR